MEDRLVLASDGEVDEAGAAEQARMVAIAKAAGMRLLGPNCLGLFNRRRVGPWGARLWLNESGQAAADSIHVEHNGLLLARGGVPPYWLRQTLASASNCAVSGVVPQSWLIHPCARLPVASSMADSDSAMCARWCSSGIAECSIRVAETPWPSHSQPQSAKICTSRGRRCTAMALARPGLTGLWQALEIATMPSACALGESTVPTHDSAALLASLRALTVQLQDSDMVAMESMAQLQQRFGATLGCELAPLHEAIGALDFERALRVCSALIESQTA